MRTRILLIGESGGEFSDDSFILEKQLTVTNISKKQPWCITALHIKSHSPEEESAKNEKHYMQLYFHHEFAKSKSLQEIHEKHKPPCVIDLIHGIPASGYFSSDSFMGFIEL